MSLYSALRAGVSGLFAQTQSMAMISDNIANVSTNGYKLVRASFSSLVTIQGNNGAYTAGSVRALPKRGIDVAGSLASSNNPLDLSIVGEGFFAVTDRLQPPTNADTGRGAYYTPNGEVVYSRNGEFRRDADGNLRNPAGYYLLGWPVIGTDSNGDADFDRTNLPSTLTAVSVQATTGAPQPSKNLTLNANIDSKLIGSGRDFDVTMNIYDRQGTLRTLRVTFDPIQGGGYRFPPLPPVTVPPTIPLPAIIQESYAYEVSMAFEGTNPPNFRNGGSTSSRFVAAFTSTGQFKTFLQPAELGVGTVGDAARAAVGVRDGRYATITSPPTSPLSTQNGLVPPLSSGNLISQVNAQLSDTDNSVNETLWDLGAVSDDGTNVEYLGYQQGAGITRPDLRIVGVPTTGNDRPYFDLSGPAVVEDDVAYGRAVIFDVDFGGDGFQYNGLPQDPTLTPIYDNDVQISLNFGAAGSQDGLTHYNSPSAITNITQDGFTIGQLEGVQISETGIVTAVYDNGSRRSIAQVPVVSFNSPNNLEVANGNAYRQSEASGQAIVRFPGTSGVGTLAPSTVETSNVDIAEEFTHMIITQRAYSANTKIITTVDEMLDELIRAKR